jgi:hypothetical protein
VNQVVGFEEKIDCHRKSLQQTWLEGGGFWVCLKLVESSRTWKLDVKHFLSKRP